MKKIIFSLIIFILLLEVQGVTLINRNNKAVEAIKDTLLYRAETELEAGLEKSPDDPILNYNYGLVKLRQFEENRDASGLEAAIKSFEKAKVDTTESNLQAIYYNQANAYYNSQDYSNAIHNYQYSGTYLDSTNVDPDLLYNYANSIYKFAETNPEYDSLYTMAEDIYKSTSGLVDSSHKQKIWHNLGNSAFQQEKYQEAIGYYVQALTLDPSSEDTRINYEIALRKLAEQQSQQQENQENQENNQEQEDKQEQSEENQEKSENQQQQEQKQEEEAQEKQDQYDELSEEEKEKLEAEKKLDALLQQQSRPEQDDKKPTIREQRPSGRYW